MASLRQRVVEIAQDALSIPSMKDPIRGLGLFIAEVRRCKSKEAELKCINKELGTIRAKFKGDKALDGYQKKKYLAKLIFAYLLGYTVDFGHLEAINLLSSEKFSEKSIGYMFISVLFAIDHDSELIPILTSALKNDMRSQQHIHVILAMQTISNICSLPIVAALGSYVYNFVSNISQIDNPILPSALPCLLSMLRLKNDIIPGTTNDVTMVGSLLKSQRYTTMLTGISLLQELMVLYPDTYQLTLGNVFSALEKILIGNEGEISTAHPEHYYYTFHKPWAMVKILRLLRLYSYENAATYNALTSYVNRVLDLLQAPNKSKRSHYINTKYSITFEVIKLVIHLDMETKIMHRACSLIMAPLNSTDPNLKGIGLLLLSDMARTDHGYPIVLQLTTNIINLLTSEKDPGVRQIGFDVAYAVCNKDNVKVIVTEMLRCLPGCSVNTRQELTLKLAVLAEKYSNDYSWYVDQILKLISCSGEHVSENVWFRLVQVITNREEIQGYTTQSVFEYLQLPDVKETMIKVGSYILGEYGNLIANDPRSSPIVQFELLHSCFPYVSYSTKYIMVTAIAKMRNLFPEIKSQIEEFLVAKAIVNSIDAELQQRGIETLFLSQSASQDLLATVYEIMPTYPERQNILMSELGGTTNNNIAYKVDEETTPQLSPAFTSSFPHPQKNDNEIDELQESKILIISGQTQEVQKPLMLSPGADLYLDTFILQSSGLLFQSDLILLNCSIFRSSINPCCQLQLKLTNRSAKNITEITYEPALEHSSNSYADITFSTCSPNLLPTQTNDVMVDVSLNHVTMEQFRFYLSIRCGGEPVQFYCLCLPVFMHHFISPIFMSSQDFYARWQALGSMGKECVQVFSTTKGMDRSYVDAMFKGINMEMLLGVDPNPVNYCGAGVLYCTSTSIGVLLRLELSMEAKAYRLTMRSSNATVMEFLSQMIPRILQ